MKEFIRYYRIWRLTKFGQFRHQEGKPLPYGKTKENTGMRSLWQKTNELEKRHLSLDFRTAHSPISMKISANTLELIKITGCRQTIRDKRAPNQNHKLKPNTQEDGPSRMPTKTRPNLMIKYHISQITISFRRTQVWEEATTTNQFKHTTNAKNHNKLINRKWRKLEKAYITPNHKYSFKTQ